MECRGDPENHCCYIKGEVCEFLVRVEGRVRCSVWGQMPFQAWLDAPVGQMFAELWPGKTCRDWPQNIPEVMEAGIGLCCWQGVSLGDLG